MPLQKGVLCCQIRYWPTLRWCVRKSCARVISPIRLLKMIREQELHVIALQLCQLRAQSQQVRLGGLYVPDV